MLGNGHVGSNNFRLPSLGVVSLFETSVLCLCMLCGIIFKAMVHGLTVLLAIDHSVELIEAFNIIFVQYWNSRLGAQRLMSSSFKN